MTEDDPPFGKFKTTLVIKSRKRTNINIKRTLILTMSRTTSVTQAALILLCLCNKSNAFTPPKTTSKLPDSAKVSLDADRAVSPNFADVTVPETNAFNPIVYAPPPVSSSTLPADLDLSKVSGLYSPAEAFETMVHKGELNAAASIPKTLVSSILGGCYVGMGAMLSLQVAGNVPDLDYGLQKFVFAALFPVNLLLALQCGGQLFTGNTAAMAAAVFEGRANMGDLARSWGLSWMGNAIGCVLFADMCNYAGVFHGGSGELAAATLAMKTSYETGPLIVRAMFCNWLVCLAIFMSMQAKDMGGKYLSIWLPVSTFVSIGFEHSVANMFLLPAGLMSESHDPSITFETVLLHNLLPVTLGNAVSGSLLVGAVMSYLFGSLGEEDEIVVDNALGAQDLQAQPEL